MAMAIKINLDTLADFFRSGDNAMPFMLRQLWNFLQQKADTLAQKSILSDFRNNPSAANKAKISAMLRSAAAPSKRGEIKIAYAFHHPKAKNVKFSYKILGDSVRFKYIGDKPLIKKKAKTAGYGVRRPAAKKAAKKAAPKKAAKKAAPKKNGFPKKKAAPKKKSASAGKTNRKRFNKNIPKAGNQVRIFTRASLNKQLVLKKATPVSVTISRERLQREIGKLSKTKLVLVSEKKKLRVQIKTVLNCRVNGPHTFIISVPEEENPATLAFSIVGTQEGKAVFSVDVWQGYELATTILFNVAVVSKMAVNKSTTIRVLNSPTGNITKGINQLRINQRQNGNKSGYDYEVTFGDINEWQEYQSPVLNTKIAKNISDLYKKIEQLYSEAAGDAKEFDNKLRLYGADLFQKLFPLDLQQLLYDNRDKLNSIQIISNEPNIPWELLVIRHPDKAKPTRPSDPFFAELGIIRWIKRGAFPSKELKCRSSRSKFVIPAYHHQRRVLPAAAKEIALLTETFKATQVTATTNAVESLLKSGEFDLLHFCCHGEGENTNIIGARLVMEEIKQKGNWKPTYLEQLFVEQCGTFITNGSAQPIIVLNGCRTGILGNKIVGYGGFAKAFIEAGAGVFVGGLWALEDTAAYNFVSSFYKCLKKGKNLSQATIEARNKSKAANNATWLSYVVYGNPFARLV
jgi:hypothetical protein